MYPKNSATPERIAVGPVIQISDGAVQTSGCAIRVRGQGGAEGDGGGTLDYSTDGVVLYTPLQAETNYTSFVVIAKKTGCIPASVTVVTTASATAGIAVCADTQKVDVNTIKTQTVTCGAGVTVLASVGTAATSTAQSGDAYALVGTKIPEALRFTGTGSSALVKADAVDAGGQAITAAGAITMGAYVGNATAAIAVNGSGYVTYANAAPPAASAVATAVWTDSTGSDFATVGSIGRSLFTSGAVPGASGGIAIVGSNMGSVSSVTGAVGSISGITFPSNFNYLSIAPNTGQVGIDLTNIKQATAPTTLANITIPTVSTLTTANPTTAAIATAVRDVSMSEPSPTGLGGYVSDIKATTDRYFNLVQDDGDGGWIFTAAALANAPTLISAFTQAALAQMVTVDTGETTAADGSVAKISQGAAGGNVTVGAMTAEALAQFATDDTGETEAALGSVAKLSQGGTSSDPNIASILKIVQANTQK